LLLENVGLPTTPVQQNIQQISNVQQPIHQGGPPVTPSRIITQQDNFDAHQIGQSNSAILLPPYVVVQKYPKLQNMSKMPTLAVKLAKESFFGNKKMMECTVQGCREFSALPKEKVAELKKFLEHLFADKCTKPEFEGVWKYCLNSIGQACKSLRLAARKKL